MEKISKTIKKDLEKRSIKLMEQLFGLTNPIYIAIEDSLIALGYIPYNKNEEDDVEYYEPEDKDYFMILTKQSEAIIMVEVIGDIETV